MEAERFDELTQALVTNPISRQQVLSRLASVLVGLLPAFGVGHAAAGNGDAGDPCKRSRQCSSGLVCRNGRCCVSEGKHCFINQNCCSGVCNRRQERCTCKRLGQGCRETRNCCADKTGGQTCQGGKCCRQPGFGCRGDAECCSGNCCSGFCCHPSQICEAGEGGEKECTCDVLLGEEPCGLKCCSPQQECRNDKCCTRDGERCGTNAQCCGGVCCDGKCCAAGRRCQNGRCVVKCTDPFPVACPPTQQNPEGFCCPPCTTACGCPPNHPTDCCLVPQAC